MITVTVSVKHVDPRIDYSSCLFSIEGTVEEILVDVKWEWRHFKQFDIWRIAHLTAFRQLQALAYEQGFISKEQFEAYSQSVKDGIAYVRSKYLVRGDEPFAIGAERSEVVS